MPYAARIGLLFLSVLAASGDASAQTTGTLGPSSDKDEVPPGACTPIGVTASGEVVFPFTCKAFLERRRGPIEEPKLGATVDPPQAAVKNELVIGPVEATASRKKRKPPRQAASAGNNPRPVTRD
jgi:hypothetical protein